MTVLTTTEYCNIVNLYVSRVSTMSAYGTDRLLAKLYNRQPNMHEISFLRVVDIIVSTK